MDNRLEVTMDVIVHATEDRSKYFRAFEELFELKEEEFRIQETTGHFNNPITILSIELKKDQAQKFVRKLLERLSDDQKKEMIQGIEERTVDSRFHIRFDKQEVIKGNLMFKEHEAVKLKIYTQIYNKKDTVKIFKNLFESVN